MTGQAALVKAKCSFATGGRTHLPRTGSSARPRPRDLSNAQVLRSKVVGVVGCFEPFGVCRARQVQVVDGLAGAKPTKPAQKMNGTSILVERLYTG